MISRYTCVMRMHGEQGRVNQHYIENPYSFWYYLYHVYGINAITQYSYTCVMHNTTNGPWKKWHYKTFKCNKNMTKKYTTCHVVVLTPNFNQFENAINHSSCYFFNFRRRSILICIPSCGRCNPWNIEARMPRSRWWDGFLSGTLVVETSTTGWCVFWRRIRKDMGDMNVNNGIDAGRQANSFCLLHW